MSCTHRFRITGLTRSGCFGGGLVIVALGLLVGSACRETRREPNAGSEPTRRLGDRASAVAESLETTVVGEGDGPVVVMMHGYGAQGDDLVPLAQQLAPGLDTRFVLPVGPERVGAFGRAFWPLGSAVERVLAGASGERDLSGSVPEGMPLARRKVLALLQSLERPGDTGTYAVGGFSQGAMLALDVALFAPSTPRAVFLLSGTLVAESEWVPRMNARPGLKVFLSHGRQDPLLPFRMAERLRDRLIEAGAEVTWVPFDGGHEIPALVQQRLLAFLRDELGEETNL